MLEHNQVSETFSILPITDKHWMSYINKNQNANIFHHPAWSQVLAQCYGFTPLIYSICDSNGNIQAGLPVITIKNLFTKRRCESLPFTDHCFPLYEDNSYLISLTTGILNHAEEKGIPNVGFRGEFFLNPDIQLSKQFSWHTLRLEENFSKVASHIHPMHQRNAKVAIKRGVRVTMGCTDQDLESYYQLHLVERRRQGTPVQPKQFFKLIGKILFQAGLGSILFATKDEKKVAALLLLHHGSKLTYKYGASDKAYLSLRPNDLLFWTAIQWGCENGYKQFDMGRTDLNNQGLRNFKKGWGTDESLLTYYTTSKKPQISEGLVHQMKPIIQKLPLWVCRVVGELFYRYAA